MRIVFMGTPEFAIPSLRVLLDNGYDVVRVVTTPDKPAGRGQHVSASAVKIFAQTRKLAILQPEKLRDPVFGAELRFLDPDIFVVVAFRILPPEVFRIPRHGAFNLHASLLPKYRGAAPINWAVIKGERETGVTTFFLQETVDTGNMILQARVPIGADETAGELHDRLAEIGAEIVLHTTRLIESGKATPRPQDNSLASPAPKLLKDQCRIDWAKSAVETHNFVRGLSPKPCAHTFHNDTLLRIYRSRILTDVQSTVPGQVVDAGERLVVYCGDSGIEITEIQQQGKKKLPIREFLHGYRIGVGDSFH